MVNPIYTRDDQRLPSELKRIQRSLDDVQRPTGTERERSLMRLEAQVAELQARSSHVATPPDIEITATTPGTFTSASGGMTFPAPEGGGRVATLQFSGEVIRVSSSGNITVWMEVLLNGVTAWKRQAAFVVGDALSAPPAWGNPSLDNFLQLDVPGDAAANMTIRLHGHTFVAGAVTARMQNITATLTYGDLI